MATSEIELNPNERNELLWSGEARQSGGADGADGAEPFKQAANRSHKVSETNVSDTERIVSGVGGGALAAYGITRGDWLGVGLIGIGALLLQRGARGYCDVYGALDINTASKENATSVKASAGVKVEKAMTINKPAAELYAYWRKFENLPKFMKHLESVTEIDQTHSHWKATAPLGYKVEWDAEIVSDIPNNLISWRSVENADVANAGSVHFEAATGGRGTVVRISLSYQPPAGKLGAAVAWLTGEEPSVQVEEDLRRFKQLMETGENPTIDGQPAKRENSRTKFDLSA